MRLRAVLLDEAINARSHLDYLPVITWSALIIYYERVPDPFQDLKISEFVELG
ncbi:hypothetical protein [Pseudomonas putida]|uniref:hypothetical protein n=1 Tax=Pseudomonas putida TaxID=303 RepID=UPI0015767093|nr:hypothetical protein [Pseudomonas putida]